jgi:hypothetical protein
MIFRGHCLLFSTGVWQETDGQFNVNWASKSFCGYSIGIGVFVFLVSLVQLYRMSLYAYKGSDRYNYNLNYYKNYMQRNRHIRKRFP